MAFKAKIISRSRLHQPAPRVEHLKEGPPTAASSPHRRSLEHPDHGIKRTPAAP
eukprot:CAMPEP_0169470388 /NCGR_PEP_ID=MMETSP1042-20121227/24019_1 /TAXON_ID=464988 /ORGANISM="Hemiselmis andersenii, Strain CCMP1180" /LENGTH=53 /DNA_ID=CAMNT_0009583993 /DNA_START=191 /DNA_END=349 /DNA_ORIENTATION=+